MSELSKDYEGLSLVVKPAVPDDAEAIVSTQYQAWLETYPKIVSGIDESMVRDWFEVVNGGLKTRIEKIKNQLLENGPNIQCFVSEEQDKVTGHILVGAFSNAEQSEHQHVVALYSSPDAQPDTNSRLFEAGLFWLEADTKAVSMVVVETDLDKIELCSAYDFTELRKIPDDEKTPWRRQVNMPEIELVRLPAPIQQAIQGA